MEFLSARMSVERGPDRLSIVVSPRLPRWKESLLIAWFTAWTCCGIYIAVELARMPSGPQRSFVLVFMAFWVYFFLMIGRTMLWRLKGLELIRVKDGMLTIKQNMLGYGRARDHFVENISKFGQIAVDERSWKWQLNESFWVMGGERLGFEYLGRKVAFGRGLHADEARLLAAELKSALSKARRSA